MTLALIILGAGAIVGAASNEMERWSASSLAALSGEG